mgnify:CR=1 FL=1
MGLPCAHEIYHLMQNNQPIPVDEIHPQWLLKREPAVRQLPVRPALEPTSDNLGSSHEELEPATDDREQSYTAHPTAAAQPANRRTDTR